MSELIKKLVVPVSVILALIGVIVVWQRASTHDQLLDEARQNSIAVNQVQREQSAYQQLLQQLMIYSRQQPAIDRVLIAFGLKQAPPQATLPAQPAQPSARPSTTPSTAAPRTR